MTGREGWTQHERELWDARADEEAWEFAWSVMEPLMMAVDRMGHEETSLVMLHALAETRDKLDSTRSKVEEIRVKG